jgi:hypothetical protein
MAANGGAILLVNVIEAVFVHPFVPVVVTVYVPEELIA